MLMPTVVWRAQQDLRILFRQSVISASHGLPVGINATLSTLQLSIDGLKVSDDPSAVHIRKNQNPAGVASSMRQIGPPL
jgi:hypothetical protein